MTKREIIKIVLDGKRPSYVPWSFGFTKEAKAKLREHFGAVDLDVVLQNRLLKLGSDIGLFQDIGGNCVRDVFSVVWDRIQHRTDQLSIKVRHRRGIFRRRLGTTTWFADRNQALAYAHSTSPQAHVCGRARRGQICLHPFMRRYRRTIRRFDRDWFELLQSISTRRDGC